MSSEAITLNPLNGKQQFLYHPRVLKANKTKNVHTKSIIPRNTSVKDLSTEIEGMNEWPATITTGS